MVIEYKQREGLRRLCERKDVDLKMRTENYGVRISLLLQLEETQEEILTV